MQRRVLTWQETGRNTPQRSAIRLMLRVARKRWQSAYVRFERPTSNWRYRPEPAGRGCYSV